ncbi:MAG: SMC family ATPase [Pyrinomonadaceae bacterium]
MHIKSIELENIKSYAKARFDLEPGTTAIMGENGAGKTTIIESVAWTLFDLLDYKKEDFLRRGAKKGVVRVEFESGLDERLYVVQRDTRTGYFVYDPRLDTRIADKKEEVTRFLWQHLGVEPGTDLESLFRRAVGVPQGTFTAIFLESPTERKKAFDKLLRVEEYRIGAMKLGQTAKFVEESRIAEATAIARLEGMLSNLPSLLETRKTLEAGIKGQEKEAERFKESIAALSSELSKLESNRAAFEKANSELNEIKGHLKVLETRIESTEKDVEAATRSATVVEESKTAFEEHQSALEELKAVEQKLIERSKNSTEIERLERLVVANKTEAKSVAERMERIETVRKDLERLAPLAADQERMETRAGELNRRIAELKGESKVIDEYEAQRNSLRSSLLTLRKSVAEAERSAAVAAEVPALAKRSDDISAELARIEASLERDLEFREQIRGGLCPVFSEKCLNLKPGDTLDAFLDKKTLQNESNKKALAGEKAEVSKRLQEARKAEKSVAELSHLRTREDEITKEGMRIKEDQEKLLKQLEELPTLSKELETLQKEIASIEDPKSKIISLNQELERGESLAARATELENEAKNLSSELESRNEAFAAFGEIDKRKSELVETRDRTAEKYRDYLQNQSAAARLDELKRSLEALHSERSEKRGALLESETHAAKAAELFDQTRFLRISDEHKIGELKLRELETELRLSQGQIEEVSASIASLEGSKKELVQHQKEKDSLDRLFETISFIRETLKSAAPNVAKNYVFHVSVEANNLYREITGNAETTLRWNEEYAIEIDEGGYSRPFLSLSGGEQMAAALSVRLALLKQLSDVRIAFFDEPTTNMDAERRERLAEQISRITESRTFNQLFVISHDDTFESYADHVVTVGE